MGGGMTEVRVIALGMYEMETFERFCDAVEAAMKAAAYDEEWTVKVVIDGMEIHF